MKEQAQVLRAIVQKYLGIVKHYGKLAAEALVPMLGGRTPRKDLLGKVTLPGYA